jgi:hypothetical protein
MTSAAQRHQRPPSGGPGNVVPQAPLDAAPGAAAALAVADAVLYEGYLLYPYRRSAAKNQVRWQFGVLAPRSAVDRAARPTVAGSAETWRQQTEVLLEAPDDAVVQVRLRFLQPQHRGVEQAGSGGWTPVDALEAGGARVLSFDEAVPREVDLVATVAELRAGRSNPAGARGGTDVEPLPDDAGRIVRRREPLAAALRVTAEPATAPFPLLRLRVVVENTVDDLPAGAPRPEVLRRSLVATHSVLAVCGGRFLSLLEPPEWAAGAAAACTNLHTFPVLAGHDRDLVLSSPVILYDHPRIAPESPGQLFDSGEIDEILSLRTLTMTDAEKAEARATDPRAAEIVDRVDAIPGEVLARLHGAVRSLRPVPPEPDAVLVGGTRVTAGSRVRLRPRRHGTDAQDMFLTGRTATVDRVLCDVDGSRFVAVTLDDDPGADLLADYGRHYHFTPDEIEVAP